MTPEQRQALIVAAKAKRSEIDAREDTVRKIVALVSGGLPTTLIKIKEWFEELKTLAEEVRKK